MVRLAPAPAPAAQSRRAWRASSSQQPRTASSSSSSSSSQHTPAAASRQRRCPLRCQALQQQQQQQSSQAAAELQFSVLRASTPAELRAAGYLRAATFYTYPPDRSEYSTRMHRRMKGDLEWESVTRKVGGTEPDYKALRVACLIAAVTDDPAACPVAEAAAAALDPSAKLPADPAAQQPARIVVGSLDLNQGPVLPAEELVGRLPPVDQATRRAYLSNVCVTAPARRHGVAAALIREAASLAAQQGVEHLYVHVVADNTPAHRLYLGLGFEQEAEESEGFARALQRPRRLLLHKQLGAEASTGL